MKIPEDSWVLEVKVTPKSKHNKIIGIVDGVLKVHVSEVPENGKANYAVVDLLSSCLGLPKRDVIIISGSSSKRKKVMLPNSIKSHGLFKH